MKKFLKITAIIAVIGAILFIAAVATVPLWFPVKMVKDEIVKQVSFHTGRTFVIEDLQFNVFRGFELRGVSMAENPRYKSKTPFIKTDLILLKYNLLALFKMTLLVNDFQIVAPYGNIIQEADGTFNFTDIVDNLTKDASQKAPKEQTKTKAAKAAPKKAVQKAPFNIIVTSVSIKNGNFMFLDRKKVPETKIKIESFNFHLQDVTLSALTPVGLVMDCTAYYNNYKIPVVFKSKTKLDLARARMDITINPFSIGGVDSTGVVSLVNYRDVKGDITSVSNTKKMLEVLPPELNKQVQDFNIDIAVKNHIKFTLVNKKFTFDNTLEMKDGTFEYKKNKFVENLKASLNVNSNFILKSNFDFLLAGQPVNMKANGTMIDRPFSSTYTIDIYSPKFAAEYLLGMFPKKEKKKAEAKAPATAKQKAAAQKATRAQVNKMKGQKAPGVYVNLKADSIFYKQINTGKTIASIRFVDNKLYSEFSMNAYEGSITSNLTADINKETYTFDAKVKGVKADKLIDDAVSVTAEKEGKKKNELLADLQGKVHGGFDMKCAFSGTNFVDVPHNIKGSGDFAVTKGRLSSLTTARDLSNKLGLEFLKRDLTFDILAADYSVAKGRIDIKNFRILEGPDGNSGEMKVRGSGWMTVDDDMDFKTEIDFNPRIGKEVEGAVARNLGIQQIDYAYNKDGWLPFDLRMYGQGKPKKYDYSQPRMIENVKRNLQKKVEEEGKRMLEEKKPEIEQKAKEIFNNLFGK